MARYEHGFCPAPLMDQFTGDPRAAVTELVAIIQALLEENKALVAAVSQAMRGMVHYRILIIDCLERCRKKLNKVEQFLAEGRRREVAFWGSNVVRV